MKAIRLLSHVVVLFILILGLNSDSGIADTRDVALVLKVKGQAEQQKTKTPEWLELNKADRLKSGDKVRTGVKSLVAMVFTDDKSMLKVRSDSEIQIGGQRQKRGFRKRLFMGLGQMWAKVNPRGAGFRLETPSGVAAVKGTIFWADVYPDSTNIDVDEGEMEITNPQGTATVGKGQRGTLTKRQPPQVRNFKRKNKWAQEPGGEVKLLEMEVEDKDGKKKIFRIYYRD